MVKLFTQVLKRQVLTPEEILHTEVKHMKALPPSEVSTIVDTISQEEAMSAVLKIRGTAAVQGLSKFLHAPKSFKGQVIWEDDIEHLPAVLFPANVPLAAKAGSIYFLLEQIVEMPHASCPVFVPDADNCLDDEVEGRAPITWIDPVTGA
ncbi:hypothetical protein C0989_011898 [Termitomyces sp. Mn162]|nr:hypothetical protein C0989_011898 [Termitomyces sp. Mn162]